MAIRERNMGLNFLRRENPLSGRDAAFSLDDRITQYKLDRRGFFEEFTSPVAAIKSAGAGAATGTTGDVNLLLTPENIFEYHIKGTQTIVAPTLTTVGLDLGSMDQTAADGIEITPGILGDVRNKGVFLVGTDAFFVKLKVKVEDASGCNPLLIGFRKCEAYQAASTAYADYALFGIIGTANPNTIKTRTETAGGGNTDTTLAATWADGATKTLEVRVNTAGAVTYYIDGAIQTDAPAYSLTSGLYVTPSLTFIQAADIAGKVEVIRFEANLQDVLPGAIA